MVGWCSCWVSAVAVAMEDTHHDTIFGTGPGTTDRADGIHQSLRSVLRTDHKTTLSWTSRQAKTEASVANLCKPWSARFGQVLL